MGAIDVGNQATNRNNNWGTANYTLLDLANPADGTGTITSIEIWAVVNLTGARIGVFYLSGGKYYCRGSATLGAVTAGSKQIFNAPADFPAFPVEVGDVIGLLFTGGQIENSTTDPTDMAYYNGEVLDPGDNAIFTTYANHGMSVYGTGVTSAAPASGGSPVQALRAGVI